MNRATQASNGAAYERSHCPGVVEQALHVLGTSAELVRALSDKSYATPSAALGGGTIGKHTRHLADHFVAALDAVAREGGRGGVIDYDHRDRDVPMETDRDAALATLESICGRLRATSEADLTSAVVTRVMLSADGSCTDIPSSLAREIAFASHHAIHHQAMIGAIARECGVGLPEGFGRAPSTINHESARRGGSGG